MAHLHDFLDIICSEEPPEPTIEVSLVAADIDMHRQDRAQTQLRPAVNKRPERRVARYPGPKKRSKVERSAVAACMREAKANTRALQHATDQVQSLHALVQPARKRCRGLDVREAKVAGGQPTSWSQNVAVAHQRIREDILGSHFGRGCPLLIRRVLAHTQQRENESVTRTQTLQSHSRAQSYIHVYAEPHF